MTVADYIRTMNDEELADLFDNIQFREWEAEQAMYPDINREFLSAKNGWLAWLKQPAKKWAI